MVMRKRGVGSAEVRKAVEALKVFAPAVLKEAIGAIPGMEAMLAAANNINGGQNNILQPEKKEG
ncbi:MAG TPA: hypothetical protein G4N91_01670 [Dehalococcoidia bacterium]|nr:hypothetical protein [Dehalococcoidia bacterium]